MEEDILGKEARDTITGFNGTITAEIRYLAGTTQYLLERFEEKHESVWVDAGRLEVE